MFVFGSLAFLLGLLGLIRPEVVLSLLGFTALDRAARVTGDYTLGFVTAASMASFNHWRLLCAGRVQWHETILLVDGSIPADDIHRLYHHSSDTPGSNPVYFGKCLGRIGRLCNRLGFIF